MARKSLMVVILGCVCFFLFAATIATAEDAATTASQVTSELQQEGAVTQSEAEAIQAPLQDMAEKGATKEELKSAVAEFSGKGVKADELTQSVNSMKDLVNDGEAVKEAGSVVSEAVAQAHQQGLKGKDLAAKVHEAVQQRKAQREQAKKETQERVQKETQERVQKETQERVQKETQERVQTTGAGTQQAGTGKSKGR